MSVMQIEPEVLNAVNHALVKISFRKTCDEWYSPTISLRFKHSNDKTKLFVKTIADMNAKSWSLRYTEPCESLRDFVGGRGETINIYQFLKYIQLIICNSCDSEEAANKEEKSVIADLKKLEQEIMRNIIWMHPKYQNAKWSSI
jgi:hypothetical protein